MPSVEDAFALGWHLAELRYAGDDPRSPSSGSDQACGSCLRRVSDFQFGDRLDLLARQLEVSLQTFPADVLAVLEGSVKTISRESAKEAPTTAVLQRTLDDLPDKHVEILKVLTSQDFKLGKAYGVGVELAETVLLSYAWLRGGAPQVPLEQLWDKGRIRILAEQIRDLKTLFRPYATDATAATLLDWVATFGDWSKREAGEKERIANERLRPQGDAWRAMLSGEKLPTDFLQVSEYVTAVGKLIRDYVSFTDGFLRQALQQSSRSRWPLAALVVLLAAVGGALFLVVHNPAQTQGAYVAIVSVLGTFGISAATAVAAVKKALGTAEQHLWQAETAAAIAVAVNWVPVKLPPSGSEVDRLGRLTQQDRWYADQASAKSPARTTSRP